MSVVKGHSIRYFGIADDGSRVPCNRQMKGKDWGWDATCSCGWDSRTGGTIHARIVELVADHKAEALNPTPEPTAEEIAAFTRQALDQVEPTPTADEAEGLLLIEVNESRVAEQLSTKTPFRLFVRGKVTVFSRKDRAVTAGEATGETFTVTNPKGKVVHSHVVELDGAVAPTIYSS